MATCQQLRKQPVPGSRELVAPRWPLVLVLVLVDPTQCGSLKGEPWAPAMAQLIAGKFQVSEKIGSGSFGDIYMGTNITTGAPVAIKLESVKAQHPLLVFESKLYKLISNGVQIPAVHWYGVEGEYNVMVIDLLGPSLEDLS